MRPCLRVLLLIGLLLDISAARAEDAKANAKLLAANPNGCGSSWTVYLVPDSIPLLACTFRAACDEHDGCYGKCTGRVKDRKAPQCEYLRCREGGDLYRAPRCRTDVALIRLASDAQRRRSKCDTAIGAKIRQINAGRPVCQAFAYVYEKAVRDFGDTFFQGIRAVANTRDQPQEDYNAAIREFFLHGTPEEFEAFNKSPPSLDPPLKYEKGKGLISASN